MIFKNAVYENLGAVEEAIAWSDIWPDGNAN